MTEAKPPFNYQAEAAVTLSNNFHGGAIPARLLRNVLEWLIQNGNHADELKKAIFYGRDLKEYERYADEPNCMFIGEKICPGDAAKGETIFHAIIGKITEATELGELLYGVLFKGKEFDTANFVEEIGDGLWYDAAGLSAVGMTFDEAQRINIAKLRKRFPGKFNEFDANNRDLFGEREILEAGVSNGPEFADGPEFPGWETRSAKGAEIVPPPGYRFAETDGEGHRIEVTSPNGFVKLAPGEEPEA